MPHPPIVFSVFAGPHSPAPISQLLADDFEEFEPGFDACDLGACSRFQRACDTETLKSRYLRIGRLSKPEGFGWADITRYLCCETMFVEKVSRRRSLMMLLPKNWPCYVVIADVSVSRNETKGIYVYRDVE